MQIVIPSFRSRPSCSAWFTLALLASSTLLVAQGSSAPTPAPVITFDGGTRQTLESIFIPPIAHAPFSLTLDTEWTRPLGNGGTYTVVNTRHIKRDAAGRIYEERWYLVPKNGKLKSTMTYIQIADPTEHTLYNCEIEAKKCYLLTYNGSTTASYLPAIGPSGPLQDGNGYRLHEDLGHDTVAGQDTVGYRETTTINPWVAGNDQPMVTTREFWYSPQLKISLLSKVEAPQIGKQQFTAQEVSTMEPESQYFALPEGFTVVDQRKTNPPQ